MKVNENGGGDCSTLRHLAVFYFSFDLDPGTLFLLLLSNSSGVEVVDFLTSFHGSVNDARLYLCMLKKHSRGGQCFTQSLANAS